MCSRLGALGRRAAVVTAAITACEQLLRDAQAAFCTAAHESHWDGGDPGRRKRRILKADGERLAGAGGSPGATTRAGLSSLGVWFRRRGLGGPMLDPGGRSGISVPSSRLSWRPAGHQLYDIRVDWSEAGGPVPLSVGRDAQKFTSGSPTPMPSL